MSRIGKKEIPLPKGVEVSQDGGHVVVKGPKGSLQTTIISGISVSVENNVVKFERKDEEKKTRAFHGLMRALVANNVKGVSEGFKRELDIVGVGYRAEVKGREVVFQLGYSHPDSLPDPGRDRNRRSSRRAATSRSRASTSSASDRPPRRFAACASRIPTRAKASSTRMK